MRELLNTLYIQTPGAVLHLDHDAILARVDGVPIGRVPLRRLEGIVTIGRVSITPALIHECANRGIGLCWFSPSGRFAGSLRGRTSGNVLLRLDQYRCHEHDERRLDLARTFVAAKLINCARFARHAAHLANDEGLSAQLRARAHSLEEARVTLSTSTSLDSVRGIEGAASREHFIAVRAALKRNAEFSTRTRRPPLSPFNAVLSFVYSLARLRIEHACEAVGLDPQVGFLHHVRPGRPALALDLMEEHRPKLDHLCVTLNNRGQLPEECFERRDGGSVLLNEAGRKVVLTAWSSYLEKNVQHHVLKEEMPNGLVYPVQAVILARHIRGDLPHYLPQLTRPD
ncbi:MAG: CRISPR-associated endonuclease Cas1 [Actinomycetota bacterium]